MGSTISESLSEVPSNKPSDGPSNSPSGVPSASPSEIRSNKPTIVISNVPSENPSDAPSEIPSNKPTILISDVPSENPSDAPSDATSDAPSKSSSPSSSPSEVPSDSPSEFPSEKPSKAPPLAKVENQSAVAPGTTADELETGMQDEIKNAVNGRRRARNLREGRTLEEGICRVDVTAELLPACDSSVTDATLSCFGVTTVIQEPQPDPEVTVNCDVNVAAQDTGSRLRNGEIEIAGEISGVEIILATEEPSSQPSQVPSDSPSGASSIFPSRHFDCSDNENFIIRVGRRKQKRMVRGCSYVRRANANRVCSLSERKGRRFRKECPTACQIPRCTCTDSRYVRFEVGSRRFRKRCSRIKLSLCANTNVENSCPNRCDGAQCEGSNIFDRNQ